MVGRHRRGLARRSQAQPELRVVVVVPRYPDQDGRLSGPPNRIGQLIAMRHLGSRRGPVPSYDLEGDEWPIYVHAKVCIIDDVWMTIGSDNLNRRSWTHDSELSCAIIDETRTIANPPIQQVSVMRSRVTTRDANAVVG